ncbi:DEAD/DEAH box helicase [Actinobacteria bacterium YIM 96077]|uniref:ATP-dependent helicase n=1 Tax=Phytoactinopolyspora halophila TaxID=1981511 RepID=A0A329R032_9ACTN|nr:DEAD/DEAH box helicase [Phytoactinopolyspora halophila]AYY11536.1 DEAD/DEAH box helicase [Actinobacteria bacterium YIM 96077]RAW17980.1 ATP-dependent helicase [Phytoactinopolyspora halophila]
METELLRSSVTFQSHDPPRSGRFVPSAPESGSHSEWSLAEAVPALCSVARPAHPVAEFWRAATLTALTLVKQRRIEPYVTGAGDVAWRLAELSPAELQRLHDLESSAPPGITDVRAYLDAVADYLANPDMAAGVTVSLRIELPGGLAALERDEPDGRFLAIVHTRSVADPERAADAADLWEHTDQFGLGARAATMLALRRAASAWQPLNRLLRQPVPGQLLLDDDEMADLLGGGAERLADIGVEVAWPVELGADLTATAVIPSAGPLAPDPGQPGAGPAPALLDPSETLHMGWRFSLGGAELDTEEREALARARQPFVRLGERWTLVDPRIAQRAAQTDLKAVNAIEALGAALTGTTEIDGERVAVDPTGWLRVLVEQLSDPESGTERVVAPAGLTATLRDYQLRGLRWLHQLTSIGLGACLADDMGLGKTITVIALHLHRQSNPSTAGTTLVVCPASVMSNWEREIARFAPGTPVRRYHGSRRRLARDLEDSAGGFVITTYATLRSDVADAVDHDDDDDGATLTTAPWSMIIADEAQHMKNPQSKTARAMRSVPAPARVALTGTPIENNLSELWAILDWATPGLLGSHAAFRRRWADPIESGRLEPERRRAADEATKQLNRLVGPFLLRRRKSDPGIAPELPSKIETDRPFPLSAEQVALYDRVTRETMERIRSSRGMERRGLILALLTALKQICNHPAQYQKQPLGAAGRSGKLDLLDELITNITASDDAVLVFTQYVAMARLLEEHFAQRGVPVQVLHGGTPVEQREEMVRRFQESPPAETPVFVLSLKAAGTGLNLTRAGHVVHYDRWWNPAVEEQATDRAYRIGQDRSVHVHRLIAEGTVEDRITTLMRHKRELADAVLASGEAALSELSDAELVELVQLHQS